MSALEICNALFDKHQLLMLLSVDQAFCESYTCKGQGSDVSGVILVIRPDLDIETINVLSYPVISKNIVWLVCIAECLHFSFYLKLLIFQSKFSGTRKFTIRHQ